MKKFKCYGFKSVGYGDSKKENGVKRKSSDFLHLTLCLKNLKPHKIPDIKTKTQKALSNKIKHFENEFYLCAHF